MSPRVAAVRRGLSPAAGILAPADRRFRRSDLRASRGHGFRQGVWLVGKWMVAGGLVGALLIWGGPAVMGSSLMRVSHIVVRGNARLSVGEVEALVDGIRGESILRVDFDRYRRRLMDSPWVAGVSMWRVLPSTVEVRVVERTPLVIARVGQQLYLVDDQGVIIDEFGPQYRQYDLPIVEGLVTTPVAGGPAVEPERVRLADRLIRALDARPALRERLSQVDVSNPREIGGAACREGV